MAVSSRALLLNGGNIEPNLYKTNRRGNYITSRSNNNGEVNTTPNRKKKIGRLFGILKSGTQVESIGQKKKVEGGEEGSLYSYIAVTIPTVKKTDEGNRKPNKSIEKDKESKRTGRTKR